MLVAEKTRPLDPTWTERTVARLKADQKRFMARQSERLKQLGIHPSFSVSPVHIKVTDQKTYEDRDKPDIVYAEWTASEKDGGIVVTRIDCGYLKNGEGE